MKRSLSHGFSLIELMTVVVIVGILASIGSSTMSGVFLRQQFDGVVAGTANVFLAARFNAIRTAQKTAVSIENRQIVAFIDTNNNEVYDNGELVVSRYPVDPQSVLPAGTEVDCVTLRERGVGPRTAFFDERGFYIDIHDGVSRHGANLCISEAATGRNKTVSLSPFGNVAIGADRCESAPFICPNVAPD